MSMITVLTGGNSFEIARALDVLRAGFDGEPEVIDGAELELRQLPDLVMGATLFSTARQVIIKDLASNKTIWPVVEEWIGRVADDVQLILVEPQLDKRTKTYKALKAQTDLREFAPWKDGDLATAQRWVTSEAAARGITLDAAAVRALVARVGADQWQLHYALEKLAVLDAVTPAVIEQLIDAQPGENVFQLLDVALRGERRRLSQMLATLRHSEDGFRLFGLLSGQVFQLAALAVSDRPLADVAAGLGASPYALGKLQAHADRLGRAGVRRVVRRFADADHRLKTGSDDEWTVLEVALLGLKP